VVVDVLDHEGDLVAVAGEHNARLAARVQLGNHVPVAVGANLVGVGSGPRADHVLHGMFKTGRAGRLEKILEKR
jgi:hypothetical protein